MTDLKIPSVSRVRLRTATPGGRTWHPVLIVAALSLWALSLPAVDLSRINGYGLISVLPPTYFVAIGMLCAGFAAALVGSAGPRTLLAYPLALLTLFHLVVPIVFAEPRYSYVYKHIAVARYISEFGGIDRTVDIYHNWPGIFAAAAVFSDVARLDPAVFANWADPFFATCGALAVYFLARSLTTDPRRVCVTVWLYVMTSSGSQVYFAPQSLGFFLALVALGVGIRWLGPTASDRTRPLFRAVEGRIVARAGRLLTRAPWVSHLRLLPVGAAHLPGSVPLARGAVGGRAAGGALLLMATAVVITHQLSPFFLAMWLGALVVSGRLRAWWMPVAVVGLMAFWIYLSYDYISLHFTLFAFDPFENVKGTQASIPAPGSPEFRIVGLSARVLIVLIVGAAALSWWPAHRSRRETFVWIVAVAPAVVLLVQSYGGEAIYRVVMFMLPLVCYLASRAIATRPRRRPRLRILVMGVTSFLVSSLFLLNYFGLDQVNNVQPQEVRASEWFETNAPPGAMLAYLNGYAPTPATAAYAEHLNVDGNWGGGIFSDTRFAGYAGRALTAADLPDIIETWRSMSRSGEVFVMIGPTQIAAVETYQYSPPGSIRKFVSALLNDPALQIVYQDGDAYILRVVTSSPE